MKRKPSLKSYISCVKVVDNTFTHSFEFLVLYFILHIKPMRTDDFIDETVYSIKSIK